MARSLQSTLAMLTLIKLAVLVIRLSSFNGCTVVDTFDEGIALSCVAGDPANDCHRDIAVSIFSDLTSEESE